MKAVKFMRSKMDKVMLLMVMLFTSITAIAQEANTVTTTTKEVTTTEEWYANPLYLIIGAVLFIILIAIIVRGNKRA